MGLRLRTTDHRERRLKHVMEVTGEKTKAGAIDVALQHYLDDYRTKEMLVDDLDREMVEALSTAQLPMEKDFSTRVGPD